MSKQEYRSWYRYSVGVWESHANIRGLYIFLEHGSLWRVASLPTRESRRDDTLLFLLINPRRGFIGAAFIPTIFLEFVGEFWRRGGGGGGRSGKENLKVQLAVLRLAIMEGEFENDLGRRFSLKSDKGYVSVCRRCETIYLYCTKQRKARDERQSSPTMARSKYSFSSRPLLPV